MTASTTNRMSAVKIYGCQIVFFHLHPSYTLVGDFLTEQSCGLDAQHDDQQRKGERIGEGWTSRGP